MNLQEIDLGYQIKYFRNLTQSFQQIVQKYIGLASVEIQCLTLSEKQNNIKELNNLNLTSQLNKNIQQISTRNEEVVIQNADDSKRINNNSIKNTPATEVIENNQFHCPICDILLHTLKGFFRHIIEYHSITDFDNNFYCPYCEYHSKNLKSFCQVHLINQHGTFDKITDRKYYYCPFQRKRYNYRNMSVLSNYINSTTKYTKIDEQIRDLKIKKMNNQFQNHTKAKQILLQEKKQKYSPFIRGQTEIKCTKFSIQCPVCSMDGFHELKVLATHIKTNHNSHYPNYLFCPHCQRVISNFTNLSSHLLSLHPTNKENNIPYYMIQDNPEKFFDPKKIALSCQNYMAYYTFFNPYAPENMQDQQSKQQYDQRLPSVDRNE